MKIKHFTAATLAALMCLSSSMMNVFADDTSTDDHTTNIGYTVDESYKWQAPADIVFTTNIDTEVKTGTVSVTENIIEATKTLVISIGSGEDFKLTSAEGATRDYTVSKEAEVLSAGSRVLLVPSGTYDGTQDLNFELQGVVTGNTSQKAGIYTGTLNFEAVLTSNFRIEYHMDGGTNNPANPSEYEKDAGDVTLQNPTKDGYTFEGWFTEPEFTNQVTAIANGTEGNIDLYAKWEATAYTISYELNGGTNNASNPTGYNATTLPITLLEPTKTGATFAGWYDNSGFSGSPVTELAGGTTGDKTFYAKWDMTRYTISYDLDGGSFGSTAVTSYTVDDLPLTLPTPTKSGKEFKGWMLSDSTVESTVTTTNMGNKSYKALWEDRVEVATFRSGSNTVGLTWEELKQESNGTTYGYRADLITDEALLCDEGNQQGAFKYCSNLISITLPDSVTSIEGYTFDNCESLTSITTSYDITSIGEYAFNNCWNLQRFNSDNDNKYNLPYITDINFQTFTGCPIATITIPTSVISIGGYSFANSGLTAINYEGTISQWDSLSFDSSWNYGINDYTVYCTDGTIAPDGTITYN